MTLKTLGGLEMAGSSFARPKPLLLLVYLSLQGPQERRHLAELFWPGNADALNSLSVTLSRIRRGIEGAIEADEVRVWTPLKTDSEELGKTLETHQFQAALEIYRGPFLEGVYLEDWGSELEEWIYQKREALATQMRGVSLSLAEQAASKGQFEQATQHAEAAYLLKAAPDPEPEDLRRLYPLLLVGRSPQASQIQREAKALGFELHQTPEEARASFQKQQLMLGREHELRRLRDLSEGAWAWVRGGAGMGKTTLLKALEEHYLPGRSGLPYATLEPLLGDLSEGEEILLRKLTKLGGTLLLDGWEQTDIESQKLLTRLRGLKPNLRVVIASRSDPPFEVDQLTDLGPLTAQNLQAYPGAFEATGGLPALVGAYLRGEPLEAAFETRLAGLSTAAREVVLSLGLLEQPDLALVRRALGLEAGQMALALDSLEQAGLVDATGKLQAQGRGRDWLEGRQTLGAGLAIKLARLLEGIVAFPLWQRARLLWEEGDTAKVQESYIAWAKELLRRGFPARAAEALEGAPDGDEIWFWRAKSLERSGHYPEAMKAVEKLDETPEILALKSALYWRLGKSEEARGAAEKSLNSQPYLRAEALNTLGLLSFSKGDFKMAADFFQRAASIWLTYKDTGRWLETLNNKSLALGEAGELLEQAYAEILEASENNLILRAKVLTNMGIAHTKRKEIAAAKRCFYEAIQIAQETAVMSAEIRAWNGLGFIHHKQNEFDEAEKAYLKALDLARQGGEVLTLAGILANLAELRQEPEALQEAIRLLVNGGHRNMAQRFEEHLLTLKRELEDQRQGKLVSS